MFKPLLMTFMLGATSIAQAQMYYVDASNGSDTWTGTAASCTGCDPATASSGPWRTVAKVNSSSFLPGDSVLFQCGGVWRETLEVPSSGTAATPISIGSYPAACPEGSSKPEITGSERITGWSSYTGNIYVATANVSIAPRNLINNGTVDFELAPWGFYSSTGGASLTRDVTDANGSAGSGSLKFTSGSVAGDHHLGGNTFTIEEAKTYQVRFKVRADAGKTFGKVIARMAGVPWTWACSFQQVTADDIWRVYESNYCTVPDNGVAPANEKLNASFYVYLYPDYLNQGQVSIYLDDVVVTQTTPYPASVQQVFVDGQYIKRAHHPNKGYLSSKPDSVFLSVAANSGGSTYGAQPGQSFLTAGSDFSPAEGQDMVGAGIHVRTVAWAIEDKTITSYDSATKVIGWSGNTNYSILKNWGYYLDNKLWMLDESGEWYYENDPTKPDYQKLYLWLPDGGDPNAHLIEASVRDQGVYAYSKTGMAIDGLKVSNAAKNGVELNRPVDFTLDHLDVQNSGDTGIRLNGDGQANSAAIRHVKNSTITKSVRQGIHLQSMSNAVIANNTVTDTGTVGSPINTLAAISAGYQANDIQITDNTIARAGYIGIRYNRNSLIQDNVVEQTCLVLDDCGAIYTWNGSSSPYYNADGSPTGVPIPVTNSQVFNNVVRDVIGGLDGGPYSQDSSEGIYLDDFTNGVEVAWNTVINAHYGIQGNSPSNNNIHNNTLFGSRKSQINLNATVGNTSPNAVYNNQVNNNVVFSLSSEPTYELDSKFDSTAQFCAADNNNYSSMYTPIHSREQLQNWTIINDYTYAQWRQTTLRDQNSTMFDTFGISPTRVSSYSGNNLLLNPNFDANTTSWSCDSGTSACLSYVSACASGGACLGYTVTLSSGSDTYSDFRQTNINIQKDVEYLVEFDMHAGRDGTLTSFAIMHNQSPYENLGFSKKVTAGTQWKSYSYTFKANATQMALMNFNLGTNVGDYIEVDNFRLEPVTLQYNDPSDDAKIVVNKTNAVMDMYCEDSGSDPARCGDYFRFPDEQQVVWPITLPPKDSAIIVWSQNPMKDTDRDSVADQDDACPETFVTTPARVNGCSFIQKTTQADLVVEITAPSVVNQDDSIAYTVTVTNQGPNTANNVSLAGLDGCVLSSATIVSGEIATCSTSVNAMDVGTLNQSVTVSADGYDNNKTNNTANATTSVQGVLTVMRSGTGSGSVTTDPAGISCGATCAAPFDANSTVILSATAANDSTFAGWAGCVANPDSTCTMTMDASKTVTANFVLKSYTLALSKTGTGSGTVTGDGTYTHGSTATVTAMANTGSTFTGWTGPDGAECATGSVSMTADKSCTATFTLNTYALTLTKTGTGSGTVTGDGTYNYGSTATVTATPSAGSAFDGWSGTNGTECATGSVSMTADKGCTATFTLLTFKNPSGNAAQTGGDNNGYQTTPGNAYAYDTAVAIDTNSGSNTNTSCTNTGKDKHSFYNYGFSIPVGAAIKGIEVKLNAKADSTSGSPKICVQLSWDGGTTWTTAKNTATLTTALVDYTLGTSADTWGHAWSVTELGDTKFKVRVIDVSSNTSRDFSLNYVGVKVTY